MFHKDPQKELLNDLSEIPVPQAEAICYRWRRFAPGNLQNAFWDAIWFLQKGLRWELCFPLKVTLRDVSRPRFGTIFLQPENACT